MTSVAYTDRILSRAGVRARRERSPIFCAGGTSLDRDLLLRKLLGTRSPPSVGAVLRAIRYDTCHTAASVITKVA